MAFANILARACSFPTSDFRGLGTGWQLPENGVKVRAKRRGIGSIKLAKTPDLLLMGSVDEDESYHVTRIRRALHPRNT